MIPKIADWKRNTSASMFVPRTAELQALDAAIAAHGEQPSASRCHDVKQAFQAWKASYPVGCFSSYRRNAHGMVDAIEQEFAPPAVAEEVASLPVLTEVVAQKNSLAESPVPRAGVFEENEEQGRWVYHAASFEDLMGIRIAGLDLARGAGRAAKELVANDAFMQASNPLEHASLEPMSHQAATFRAPLKDVPALKGRLNRGYAGVLKRAADPVEPLRNALAIMLRYPAREGDGNTVRPSVIEGLTAKGWVNISILIELDHARLMAREAPAAPAGFGPTPWFGAMSRASSVSGRRSL